MGRGEGGPGATRLGSWSPSCFGPEVSDLPVNMFLDYLPPEASRAIQPPLLLAGPLEWQTSLPLQSKIRIQKGC